MLQQHTTAGCRKFLTQAATGRLPHNVRLNHLAQCRVVAAYTRMKWLHTSFTALSRLQPGYFFSIFRRTTSHSPATFIDRLKKTSLPMPCGLDIRVSTSTVLLELVLLNGSTLKRDYSAHGAPQWMTHTSLFAQYLWRKGNSLMQSVGSPRDHDLQIRLEFETVSSQNILSAPFLTCCRLVSTIISVVPYRR